MVVVVKHRCEPMEYYQAVVGRKTSGNEAKQYFDVKLSVENFTGTSLAKGETRGRQFL